MRAIVEGSEVPSFVHGALEEIRRSIEKHGIDVQGPPFAIYRPAARRCVDVEVGWPVSRSLSAGGIAPGELPAGLIRRDHGSHIA